MISSRKISVIKEFAEQDKETFIKATFGNEVLSELKNIHRGGTSSAKGHRYEELFFLRKVLEIASNRSIDYSQHRFSHQSLDFFDDICYENFEESSKHNYQAKNSSGTASNWNEELLVRAKRQHQTDLEFHKVKFSKNYLVVPTEEKKDENQNKITLDNGPCECICFPYYENNFTDFVAEELSPFLNILIETTDPDEQDYSAKLLQSVLISRTDTRTLQEIFEDTEFKGRPSPFKPNKEVILPDWLISLLEKNGFKYNILAGYLYLTFNKFEIKLPLKTLVLLNKQEMENISEPQVLVVHLMKASGSTLLEGCK